jgi:hypothetical protein
MLSRPVSIRGHKLEPEVRACVRATLHLALVTEAEKLHAATVSGFAPQAHKLKVVRHTYQVRLSGDGSLIIMVWCWLSNTSAWRAAWRAVEEDHGLKPIYERVPWPLKSRQPQYSTWSRRKRRKAST